MLDVATNRAYEMQHVATTLAILVDVFGFLAQVQLSVIYYVYSKLIELLTQ